MKCAVRAARRPARGSVRGTGTAGNFASGLRSVARVRCACCLSPDPKGGCTVAKSDCEAQHHAAQRRAQTAAYYEGSRGHPRIERKLAELVRWHAGRRTRYRGRLRVKIQYVLTAGVVNCKRMVKLLSLPLPPQLAQRAARNHWIIR